MPPVLSDKSPGERTILAMLNAATCCAQAAGRASSGDDVESATVASECADAALKLVQAVAGLAVIGHAE